MNEHSPDGRITDETSRYVDRDISWLSFNARVLQEAADTSVPLYERLKFLAIFSSNLNEFYQVRVASMRSFKLLEKADRPAEVGKPRKVLKEVRRIVQRQQKAFGSIFLDAIMPALREAGIEILSVTALADQYADFVADYMARIVSPHLAIHFLHPDNAVHLKDKALYLVVDAPSHPLGIPVVLIPSEKINRFVPLPAQGQLTVAFLDDFIRLHLSELLPNHDILGAYAIKVSRDAELYLDDEFSGDLLEKLKRGLEGRQNGLPTRFLYDQSIPRDLLRRVRKILKLSKWDLTPGYTYHNFHDYMSFPKPDQAEHLFNAPLPSLPHPYLRKDRSIMQCMEERDHILHFPYQQFDYVIQLLKEAASDPEVSTIKITLYRVASDSQVAHALLKALERGKKVVAFIEAKARFDEQSNLIWGERLAAAGATVLYSYPGIKVHTKLFLIYRNMSIGEKHYVYLGTGNFNEKTARIYADHALLTCDPDIARDVHMVFSLLERKIIVPKTRKLLVSPFTTRSGFESMIEQEIKYAEKGKKAYVLLKMNSLEDKGMIDLLYRASQAGVEIKIIVRGFCCLVAGVPGLSENIEVISIIDRFLEHARIYIFGNGGKEVMYLASADWMTRNLDRRVEVVFPVEHPEVYEELREIIRLQWQDNKKARIINAEQSNPYRPESGACIRAQMKTYEFLRNKVTNKIN